MKRIGQVQYVSCACLHDFLMSSGKV